MNEAGDKKALCASKMTRQLKMFVYGLDSSHAVMLASRRSAVAKVHKSIELRWGHPQ